MPEAEKPDSETATEANVAAAPLLDEQATPDASSSDGAPPETVEPEAQAGDAPEEMTAGPPPSAVSSAQDAEAATLGLMLDLPLDVTVELGRTTMRLGEALALQAGSIIELDRLPGESLDMHVNDRLVARGEVVVVNDALGLRITEIIGQESPGSQR